MPISRRVLLHAAAIAPALGALAAARAERPLPKPADRQPGAYRLGVIGCGGRGTGAAVDFLTAAPEARVVAMADVFPDRLASSRAALAGEDSSISSRVDVTDATCFTGFDGYKKLLALQGSSGVDVVVLATPPHFRPIHFAAAVAAGKHCFIEKPVAVDPAGVRMVMEAGALADQKSLRVVCGTQRRHQGNYIAAMQKIREGAIGRVVSGSCYWNQGGLWMHERKPEWSDMEWQLRNWLYFTWLSGDHIVEQHVHNLDVMNWAMGSNPIRASGSGGRQVRTSPAYGHVFDHFAIEFEYPDGVSVTSMCRQIEGCDSRVEEVIVGTEGRMILAPGRARIEGKNAWKYAGEATNPYEQEHRDLVAAIANNQALNESRRIAESTLTAIMGRMAAYTGKAVTWEKAKASTLDLSPKGYEFGPLPTPEVAMPGRTSLT
jgi:predicted dehydrogenase